jgi:hypothetical protein
MAKAYETGEERKRQYLLWRAEQEAEVAERLRRYRCQKSEDKYSDELSSFSDDDEVRYVPLERNLKKLRAQH